MAVWYWFSCHEWYKYGWNLTNINKKEHLHWIMSGENECFWVALVVYRMPKEYVNDDDKNGKRKPQRTDANMESGALEF